MTYIKHILLGKITRVHSYDGTVMIKLERSFTESIPEPESVFIETDGRPVPFFIEHFEQPDNLTLRIQFSDYKSDTRIKEFVGCNVYLTDPDVKISQFEDPQYLTDYKVFSEDKMLLGTITKIIAQPGHLLLNIRSDTGKDILLPFHDDLIIKVDKKKKIIVMIIPEGIGEIN